MIKADAYGHGVSRVAPALADAAVDGFALLELDAAVALRDAGCAVLLVSAELEEVMTLSDRLLVIHDGRIVGDVDPKVATTAEVGLLMTRGH